MRLEIGLELESGSLLIFVPVKLQLQRFVTVAESVGEEVFIGVELRRDRGDLNPFGVGESEDLKSVKFVGEGISLADWVEVDRFDPDGTVGVDRKEVPQQCDGRQTQADPPKRDEPDPPKTVLSRQNLGVG